MQKKEEKRKIIGQTAKKKYIYNSTKQRHIMKYICTVCGHVYDEAVEGTPFDQLPEDWLCPLCGVGKDLFEPEEA